MSRRFYTLDVFTGQALSGNPLAVVLDADGLDDQRMKAIAREFNLSETVFVTGSAGNRASVRIFTPGRELPFAGHPTVGTAVLLGLLGDEQDVELVLEEKIGPVPCDVRRLTPDCGHAIFTLPILPERAGALPDHATLAAGLGLSPEDIGFGTHQPAIYAAGNPFRCVPLRSRAAVTAARPTTASPTLSSIAPNRWTWRTAFTPGCSPRRSACPRTRPPDRPRRLSSVPSWISNSPPTAAMLSSSNKVTPWAGRPVSRSRWRSKADICGVPGSAAKR